MDDTTSSSGDDTLLQLQRQSARYEGLFESAPVAYLTLDGQGAVEGVNLSACAILGMKKEEILHQPFAEFVQQADSARWLAHFRRSLQFGMHQSCELGIKRKDGSQFIADLRTRNVKIGEANVVCMVLSDATEQKLREKEAMEWRKEMAELRKMQIAGQTAAAIAHELNQPLLAIATYSEAAIKLLESERPDLGKVTKAAKGCEKQAFRAGKSIHDLLGFLSLKEIKVEAFDLNEVIDEVVRAARSEHELQFESIMLLEEHLPQVFANRLHVEKVLFNMLRNGIEAMHLSGVELPAITVTVSTKYDTNIAQVTIQDNGPGVKEEHLQQLFKPFFTTKPRGIGMGLAVSRSLIEANGGQLWLDPSEGTGATFHLTLPLAS